MRQNVMTMFRCFNHTAGQDARRNPAVGTLHRNPSRSAHSLSAKNSLLRMIMVCLLVGGTTVAWGDDSFHYTGVHQQALKDNGYGQKLQQVAEYHYYYYVDSKSDVVNFELPFQDWSSNGVKADLEPLGYYRWYNYKNDKLTCNNGTLSAYSNSNKFISNTSDGLIAYNLVNTAPSPANIGAKYTPNTNSIDENWEGDIIACDVSRYCDYKISGTCAYTYSHSNDSKYATSYLYDSSKRSQFYSYGANNRSDTNDGEHGYYAYRDTTVTSWGYSTIYTVRTWVSLEKNETNCANHVKTSGTAQITQEPTLSIRYVFHVLPAKKLANDIKTALVNGVTSQDVRRNLTYEDNKRVIVGLKDDNSEFNLRVNLDQTIKKYYFYPLKDASKKHVYYNDVQYSIQSTDFEDDYVSNEQNGGRYPIFWRVYDESKSKYKDLETYYSISGQNHGYIYPVKMSDIKGGNWKTLSGSSTTTPTSFGKIYVVAMLIGGDYCPIANYEVVFTDDYPMTDTQLKEKNAARLIKNIQANTEHYTEEVSITFDESDYSAPTTSNNQSSTYPTDWSSNSYAYIYQNLDFVQASAFGVKVKHTPLHGEYGLYKSANYKGVSESNNEQQGYHWNTGEQMFDRTYELSGNKDYGYFLAIDAADESRTISTAKFKATLCSGSTIIFSGSLAEMSWSGNAERAEIMFRLYGVGSTGKTLIQSFSSGNIKTNTIDKGPEGQWYQVYGEFVLPEGLTGNEFSSYQIEIVNMCKSTAGADYAIDDIRIFTSKSMVDVIPDKILCPERVTPGGTTSSMDALKYKIRMNYETLKGKQSSLSEKSRNVYYRFVEKGQNPSNAAEGITYGNDNKTYGVATVPEKADATAKLGSEDDNHLQFEENNKYIVLAYRHFDLKEDKDYYLSVAYQTGSDGEPYDWGQPNDICSVFSDYFAIKRQKLIVNGKTNLPTDCKTGAIKEGLSLEVSIQTYDTKGMLIDLSDEVTFDWFISKKGEKGFSEIEGLQQQLKQYRDNNASSTDNYNLVKQYVDNKQLILAKGNTLKQPTYIKEAGTYVIAAIATLDKVSDYDICDVMEFEVVVQPGTPELILGMDGITYPDSYKNRVVRIGLKQIKQASGTNGGVVNIPVQSMPSGDLTMTKDNAAITLASDGTNDKSTTISGGQVVAQVSSSNLSWKDNGTVLPIKFTNADQLHEGYYYDLDVVFKNANAEDENPCEGTTTFRLVVVPEYLTWTGSDNNANWNNDSNWKRSTKDEIFKESYATSPAGADGAYVPMKFSKVTVKELTDKDSKYYPALNTVTTGDNGIITAMTDKYENGATENIQYDLMVAWDKTYAEQAGTSTGSYNCEPFYANTCEQIYFKPRAELLGQQYLTYEKAWVEKELTPKTWSLMASPLQETYAGDMYVPYATGQQDTEAFQTISWGSSYSRNNYPFYQKNWDRSGKEVAASSSSWEAYDQSTADADITKNDVSMAVGYWSHVYNDVTESYAGAKAFVVKAGDEYHPSTEVASNKAIVRLPKADTSYNYYDYSGKENTSVSGTTSKTNAHKFVVTDTDGKFTETLNTNATEGNQYYLVGNPYTASLNVKAFLNGNSSNFDASGIWTLNNGTIKAENVGDNTIIEPMGAFFVKAANDTKPSTASFTSEMTVDGHNGSASTNPAKTRASETVGEDETIVLTASSAKSSMATCASVIVRSDAYAEYENGEDVETLYNGDLDDAPTVYTVASNQAVSVNAVPSMELIPMGVVSKESEDVTIAVSKADNVDVYLFDAKTKTSTLLYSGDSITVQSNAHGRYYLSSKAIDINDRTNNDVKVYSPANGIITVATAMSDVMQSVEVFSADGKKVAQEAVNGESSKDFYVSGGLYIVKVTTSNGVKTQKVAVK